MNRQITITIDDRREPESNIVPIIERRGGEERRVHEPRWLQWTRQNDSRGKSLDGRAA